MLDFSGLWVIDRSHQWRRRGRFLRWPFPQELSGAQGSPCLEDMIWYDFDSFCDSVISRDISPKTRLDDIWTEELTPWPGRRASLSPFLRVFNRSKSTRTLLHEVTPSCNHAIMDCDIQQWFCIFLWIQPSSTEEVKTRVSHPDLFPLRITGFWCIWIYLRPIMRLFGYIFGCSGHPKCA